MPTKTFCTYNNNKALFSAELMQRRHAEAEAYSSRNKVLSDQTRNTLTWKIKVAKRDYIKKSWAYNPGQY